jgi:hypothetical protein
LSHSQTEFIRRAASDPRDCGSSRSAWVPCTVFPRRPAMQRPNRPRRPDFPKSSTIRLRDWRMVESSPGWLRGQHHHRRSRRHYIGPSATDPGARRSARDPWSCRRPRKHDQCNQSPLKGREHQGLPAFGETVSARMDAWSAISKLFESGRIKVTAAKSFVFEGPPKQSVILSRVLRSVGSPRPSGEECDQSRAELQRTQPWRQP